MEGPLDRLLEIARLAHLACMKGGARQAVTVIKIGDRRSGSTIAEKVDKSRMDR
ncbi:MAG TPA: thiamine-binding protein [Anaerolineales bacterium]|nr:thiamine-binding protein [Anaerolineales bacterium]